MKKDFIKNYERNFKRLELDIDELDVGNSIEVYFSDIQILRSCVYLINMALASKDNEKRFKERKDEENSIYIVERVRWNMKKN